MTGVPAPIEGERSIVSIPLKLTLGIYDFDRDPKAYLESIGFEFLGICDEDSFFQNVKLPVGWEKAIDDSVDVYVIVDNKGRNRFYFYGQEKGTLDRFVDVLFATRYKYWPNAKDFEINGSIVVKILDGKKVIHTLDRIIFPQGTDKGDAIDQAREEARLWLDKNYPGHRSVTTYWDD